uniref:RRM domain-containing protein n=1 Tax=Macrostomum lignano TaxID=282301 RepID=A0A1I8JRP5_9PLAT
MGPGIGGPTCCVLFEFGKLEQIQLMPAKGQALGSGLTRDWSPISLPLHRPACCSHSTMCEWILTGESIRQICGPYGIVDRCLVREPARRPSARRLRIREAEDAVLTKPNLNGANMYAGCNAISCEYVRHTAFEYFASRHPGRRHDDGRRAPAGKRLKDAPVQPLGAPVPAAAAAGAAAPPALMMRCPLRAGAVADAVLLGAAKAAGRTATGCLTSLAPGYGNVDRIKFVTSREGFALVQMLDASFAQQAVDFLHGQTCVGQHAKTIRETLKLGRSPRTATEVSPQNAEKAP